MQGMQPALYHRYGVLDDGDDDEDEGGGAAGGGGPGDFSSTAYGTMLAAAMQNMDLTDGGGAGGGAGVFEGGVVLGDVVREREVEGLGGEEGEGSSGQGTSGSWSLLAHPGGSDWVLCRVSDCSKQLVLCSTTTHHPTPAACSHPCPRPSPANRPTNQTGASAVADDSGERSMEDDAVLLSNSDEEDGPGTSGSPGPQPLPGGGAGGQGALAASPSSDDVLIVEPAATGAPDIGATSAPAAAGGEPAPGAAMAAAATGGAGSKVLVSHPVTDDA